MGGSGKMLRQILGIRRCRSFRMNDHPVYQKLLKLREHHHRLTPERKLKSLEEAKAFVHEVGLATLTGGSGLPSIFQAIQGEPYKPGSRGFGTWPRDQWWWGGEIAKAEDILSTKILDGKGVFISKRLWQTLDTIERYVLDELEAERYEKYRTTSDSKSVLQYLKVNGPTRTDLLRQSLGYINPEQNRKFRLIKKQLESLGVILGREAELETHLHIDILSRWDQRFPNPLAPTPRVPRGHAFLLALEDLLYSSIQATVVVPERVAAKWFRWSQEEQRTALQRLLQTDRVTRLALRGEEMLAADSWISKVKR